MARTLIEVYLHIVFSTKHRANIIHLEIEAELHRYIAGIIANLESRCIAVNGTENHFSWQDGYGGFSVGRSELPAVCRYIAAQKEHHRRVTYEEEFVSLLAEHGVAYDARYLWD